MRGDSILGNEINCKLKYLIAMKQLDMQGAKNKKITVKEIEEDIASFCGVSKDMITSIKIERTMPSLTVALKLAQYFKCSVDDIFEFEKEEKQMLSFYIENEPLTYLLDAEKLNAIDFASEWNISKATNNIAYYKNNDISVILYITKGLEYSDLMGAYYCYTETEFNRMTTEMQRDLLDSMASQCHRATYDLSYGTYKELGEYLQMRFNFDISKGDNCKIILDLAIISDKFVGVNTVNKTVLEIQVENEGDLLNLMKLVGEYAEDVAKKKKLNH